MTAQSYHQSVILEEGAIHKFEGLLGELNAQRIFFVVDKPAYMYSGASEILSNSLAALEVIWFNDFELNPKIEDVEKGVKLFREKNPDIVIGLGGGSALDMAKLIAGCGVQPGQAVEYATGEKTLPVQSPPVIAIPTTSGTGSEATHFAVVYVAGQKFSLAHSFLLPEYALIDPELTYSLPPKTTAACGLDALCQSVESIWAVGATDESIKYATEGLNLALNHLQTAVCNPDPKSRLAMARAAHLSGKAINISKTTAPHAISYGITTGFKVLHGMAATLTLGAFLEYNSDVDKSSCTDPRGVLSVRKRINHILKIMKCESIEQARNRLSSLMQAIDCPVRLRDAGIQKNDLPALANKVNTERLSNNPRMIDTKRLAKLLEEVF